LFTLGAGAAAGAVLRIYGLRGARAERNITSSQYCLELTKFFDTKKRLHNALWQRKEEHRSLVKSCYQLNFHERDRKYEFVFTALKNQGSEWINIITIIAKTIFVDE